MPRHSKNATAKQYFSYGERRVLKYGTISARLGSDSQKRPDACTLCLELAVDAHACPAGHLFCKECIYENLLNQKQTIKAAEEDYQRQLRERQAEDDIADAKTKNEEIDRFAMAESGVAASAIDQGKSEPKLRAFWLPDCTLSCEPDYKRDKALLVPNKKTMCPEGHSLKASQLRPVRFTERIDLDESATESDRSFRFMCPSCRKALTQAVRSVWLCSCGHVICKNCFDTLVKPDKTCSSCGCRLKHSVEWGATGFSGSTGAKLKAQVVTPAFQG